MMKEGFNKIIPKIFKNNKLQRSRRHLGGKKKQGKDWKACMFPGKLQSLF